MPEAGRALEVHMSEQVIGAVSPIESSRNSERGSGRQSVPEVEVDSGVDLDLAVAEGLFILGAEGTPGGVQLDGPLLRYDPSLAPGARALLVCEAIGRHRENEAAIAAAIAAVPVDRADERQFTAEIARAPSDVGAALDVERPGLPFGVRTLALRAWRASIDLPHDERWRVVLDALHAVADAVPGLNAALAPITAGPLCPAVARAVLLVDSDGRDVEMIRDAVLSAFVGRSMASVAIAEVVTSIADALEAEGSPVAPVLGRLAARVEAEAAGSAAYAEAAQ